MEMMEAETTGKKERFEKIKKEKLRSMTMVIDLSDKNWLKKAQRTDSLSTKLWNCLMLFIGMSGFTLLLFSALLSPFDPPMDNFVQRADDNLVILGVVMIFTALLLVRIKKR